MTGKAQREESYEIPLEVMREAIVNAVAHRDYFLAGSHTTIEIFDNRIEITNPGGLPKGLHSCSYAPAWEHNTLTLCVKTIQEKSQLFFSTLKRLILHSYAGA